MEDHALPFWNPKGSTGSVLVQRLCLCVNNTGIRNDNKLRALCFKKSEELSSAAILDEKVSSDEKIPFTGSGAAAKVARLCGVVNHSKLLMLTGLANPKRRI